MIRFLGVMVVILIVGCGKIKPQEEDSKKESFSVPVVESASGMITDTLSYPVKFSISYPTNWKKFEYDDSRFFFGAKMKCDSGVVFCPNFNIVLIKERKGLSIDLYGKFIIDADTVVKKKEVLNTMINRMNNGHIETFTFNQKFEYNNVKLGGVSRIIHVKGKSHLLLISFMAERGEEDEYVSKENQQLFYQILDSMTFWL